MTIEFIDNRNRFFQDVKTLGKKNSATLGFMPEGGFEDHAENKCIIIAVERESLLGYLMYRVVSRYSRISIVHLCVNDTYRGKGVSTALLDALKSKYKKQYRGISLSCRRDFTYAKAVWEKYGFVPLNEVRSRSFEEKYLNTWWYDFHQPDLFSSTAYNTSKVKALLDMNIIVKLRDAAEASPKVSLEDPRGLLADWLVDEAELCYAPEAYNEILRDSDQKRAAKTRGYLPNFMQVQFDIVEQKRIAKELKAIIHGTSENDISDRKQIASCIASKIPYFITYDEGLLNKREEIEEKYSVLLYNPQEFILQIDQLLHEEEYLPCQLKGVAFHSISKLDSKELQTCVEKFWIQKNNETKQEFNNLVYKIVNSKIGKLYTVKQHKEIIAFYGVCKKQDSYDIEFLRVCENSIRNSLFFQIVSEAVKECLQNQVSQVLIKEKFVKEEQVNTLKSFGFMSQPDGTFIKYAFNTIAFRHDVNSIIKERIKADFISADSNNLLKVEQILFPLKIKGLNIPTYIIPIKAYWTGQLFDFSIASEDIFGANPSKLWNFENVYFRHTRPITELVPARILWYVSGSDKSCSRSKSIVGSSYLTEVRTGKPKELFRLYKHYGIYEWKHVYELCDKNIENNIRALKFCHTEIFEKPVSYAEVQKVLVKHRRKRNTFASPVLVSESIYFDIYQLGKWGKIE